MSIIPFGMPLAEAALQGLVAPILVRSRIIGPFIANVTIREDHEDELVVTENPVEYGAAITDHSFKQPARLTIDVGYSNSSQQSLGNTAYVQDIYNLFLLLQASRIPFIVITGKRLYQDMLITLLHTTTTEETEDSLLLTVKMKQVLLVSSQTVSVPANSNLSNPASNGATTSLGTQQAVGVPLQLQSAPTSQAWH